ncbi:S26 family signal peptidase [Streptomyces sp. A1277]|uniref:S26 family signal peptidase n=1 Tax=Streptomyces sp. A1277 TaxID=2563103 RepID=UPI0010A27B7C|nr:S26 family signal peptidase [Streptomyces sp. A1277]THA31504.1 S26 family signal peptidase [Streptomyces sp. A1277]
MTRSGTTRSGMTAVIALAAAALAARKLLVVLTVAGSSMEPAYRSGDRLLMLRRPLGRAPDGTVIVLRGPLGAGGPEPDKHAAAPLIVKRLGAGPGRPVPGAVLTAVGASPGTVVPPGLLVALADSPAGTDSRTWGYLTEDTVAGTVICRLSRATAGPAAARLTGAMSSHE